MQSQIQPDPVDVARSSAGPSNSTLIDTSRYNWFELSWPTVAVCGLLVGLTLWAKTDYRMFGGAAWTARGFFSLPARVAPAPKPVLVVIANRDRQMQVVATLSPRGFEPRLAGNVEQVRLLLAGPEPGLAVLDGAMPDADAISQLLRSRIPANRIVLLHQCTPREAIGQILLDRL